jgi:hypothetical protein
MVTKAKEVPWNEVEDLMEDLRQWLVGYAGADEREELAVAVDQTTPALEPRRLEPLEIAMATLRFVQVTTGIQPAASPEESERVHHRAELIASHLGGPAGVPAVAVVADVLHGLCMYNARGLRGPLLQSNNSEQSARAKELLYDDSHVRAAEDAVHRILPAIEHARRRVMQAVDVARERHRALPELQAELRPELSESANVPGPDWPPHVEQEAQDVLQILDDAEGVAKELSQQFSSFFEPGRPRFPMTASGWQALRHDVSGRLERVGLQITKVGLRQSQSRST